MPQAVLILVVNDNDDALEAEYLGSGQRAELHLRPGNFAKLCEN